MGISIVETTLGLPRSSKRILAMIVDGLLCFVTVLLAFYLRLGHWVFPTDAQWLTVVLSWLFTFPLYITFGLYRAIFRYSGLPALVAVARVSVLYTLFYSTVFTAIGVPNVPRTLGFIQPILLFLAVGASRGFVRFWLGGPYQAILQSNSRKRVLIYGAGASGRQLAAALGSSLEMNVVGFIDDDHRLQGSILNGQKVHSLETMPTVIERLSVTDILLALPSASRSRRNVILQAIRKTPVAVRTLPGINDIAQGRVSIEALKDLDIEDLLGRESVAPDLPLLANRIAGKTVLVTGAGGSIGSELCRQIIKQGPTTLILFEMNEFALYNIHQDLTGSGDDHPPIIPLLGSVLDEARLDSVLEKWRPDIVYHAAAYKHVPLVEANPGEGVRNNVFGTLTVAQAAARAHVPDFVLISTDKAVRPTNTMGASKRLAEMVLQAMAARTSVTRFSMVRFGNVLNSSGSVVPLFREQIRRGGPVTITHLDITRYFMTIPEAAQLVIQAGAMAEGGEVFILDMGSPVRIVDLAHNMITLSGLTVRDDDNAAGDIEVDVIGLRPGEKLFEELLIDETASPTNHPRIMKANERFLSWDRLQKRLAAIDRAITTQDAKALHAELRVVVPEFVPNAEPDFGGSDGSARCSTQPI